MSLTAPRTWVDSLVEPGMDFRLAFFQNEDVPCHTHGQTAMACRYLQRENRGPVSQPRGQPSDSGSALGTCLQKWGRLPGSEAVLLPTDPGVMCGAGCHRKPGTRRGGKVDFVAPDELARCGWNSSNGPS